MNIGWIRHQEYLRNWRNSIWESGQNKRAQQAYLKWHMDFFENFYEPPGTGNTRLLDVGCGYMLKNFEQSHMLDELFERLGGEYFGVDPIDEWFALSSPYPVKLCKASGEDLPFADEQFEAVLCLGVLDHVIKPRQVLREIFRVLRPGGTLWFASGYVKGSVAHILREKARHWLGLDKSHRFIWTAAGLERFLLRASLGIVKTRDCPCATSYFIQARKAS